MLIRRAEFEGGTIADVRLAGGTIIEIGDLASRPDEQSIDAQGGLLIPGLHDHHIHLAALATAASSITCGPPEVTDFEELAERIGTGGDGWLRGIGYHESVAGMLDAHLLDRMQAERPVRIQHRSGRMWFLNSMAVEQLLQAAPPPPGLDRATGRLFDEDAWLRKALGSRPPSFGPAGAQLARMGVTGLTDMSVGNDPTMADHFAAEQARGALPQKILLAGKLSLAEVPPRDGLTIGPAKLHLHEAQLPPFDEVVGFIVDAHRQQRAVAVHCVTEVELVYTLAAFEQAGVRDGDRIEHASISPDSAVDKIASLGLAVVSQPNFVFERGDAYRRDVEPAEQALLYRLKGFLDQGVTLAAGSDAPFGSADPWLAMSAAVARRTVEGDSIGPAEALSPEQALDLYLRDPERLDRRRTVVVGAPADLCLLDRSWSEARENLRSVLVRATIVGGRVIYERVDQAPF